jgi:hypothetical protein
LTPTPIEARAAEAAAEQTLAGIKSSNNHSSFTATATAHHRQSEPCRPVHSRQNVTGKVYTLCTGTKAYTEAISEPQANPSCVYRACCGLLLELPPDRSLVLSLLEVSISFVYVEVGVDIAAIAYATVESDIFKPTKYGGKYTVTLIPGMYDAENACWITGQLLTGSSR